MDADINTCLLGKKFTSVASLEEFIKGHGISSSQVFVKDSSWKRLNLNTETAKLIKYRFVLLSDKIINSYSSSHSDGICRVGGHVSHLGRKRFTIP